MKNFIIICSLFLISLFLFSCKSGTDTENNTETVKEIIIDSTPDVKYSAKIEPLKGPFISGVATVQPIDCTTLKTVGESFTLLLNSFGQLEVDQALPGPCVQVSVTGAYMDEITGIQAEGNITLTGYADLTPDNSGDTVTFSITPLTTISSGREYTLVTIDQTHTLKEAQKQAVGEYTLSLGLPDISADGFHKMDFTTSNEINKILLISSASIQINSNTTGVVADRINTLQGDFQDGSFTQGNIDLFVSNASDVSADSVRQNIIDWYYNHGLTVTPPNFSDYQAILADTDGDGIRDASDDNLANTFSFTGLSNLGIGSIVESNIVTVSGLSDGGTSEGSKTGNCTLYQNDATQDNLNFTIQNNDTIKLKFPDIQYFNDSYSCSVTLGSQTDTFTANAVAKTIVHHEGFVEPLSLLSTLTVEKTTVVFEFTLSQPTDIQYIGLKQCDVDSMEIWSNVGNLPGALLHTLTVLQNSEFSNSHTYQKTGGGTLTGLDIKQGKLSTVQTLGAGSYFLRTTKDIQCVYQSNNTSADRYKFYSTDGGLNWLTFGDPGGLGPQIDMFFAN